jgi:phosphate-selective porin OprO and OprP
MPLSRCLLGVVLLGYVLGNGQVAFAQLAFVEDDPGPDVQQPEDIEAESPSEIGPNHTFVFPQIRAFAAAGSKTAPVKGRLDESLQRLTFQPERPPSTLGEVGPRPGSPPALLEEEGVRGPSLLGPPRRVRNLGSVGEPETPAPAAEEKPEYYVPDMEAKRRKVSTRFGNGISWRTDDDYFELRFHNLTQFDARFFNPTGDPLHDNFFIPRQRWYFQGHVSEYVDFYTVINRGYGPIDLLDAFSDFSLGDYIEKEKFQLRVGRMKTPYTYEYIKISENDLIAPERSVFVTNLAPNRQMGIMGHGQLLDKRFEYALGVFNGPRRSFQDFNSGKDLFWFMNTKPFLKTKSEALQQLNVGGSFNYGNERNPAQPFSLRTANDQSTSAAAANLSPTFFRFDPNAFENGIRMQWSGDLAYYYKSFGLVSGYQGGYADYSISKAAIPSRENIHLGVDEFTGIGSPIRTRVRMLGWSVAMFYFITGEEITRRVELLEPRRPLGEVSHMRGEENRKGRLGSVELFARFANLQLSDNVFSSAAFGVPLADPATSANRANVTDIGFNWYLNHYVKLTVDWQYSAYNQPVLLTTTTTTSFNNLFWFRTQVFF